MFQENPPTLHSTAGSICFVVPIVNDVSHAAGIVEHYQRLAIAFTKNSWKVGVLLCSLQHDAEQEHLHAKRFRACSVVTACLTDTRFPHTVTLGGPNQTPLLWLSDQVRYWLQQYHTDHRLTHIEFADHGGLGFRCIQSKRLGLEWDDVELIVTLHAPRLWQRHHEGRWSGNADDFMEEFGECYAFKHADRRISTRPTLAEEMKQLGWVVPEQVEYVRADAPEIYNLPPKACSTGSEQSTVSAVPLVSVGIAHFNLGKYLRKTLASLAEQTYPNLEVFVVDDGSTEPYSRQVFDAMQNEYPQFQYYSHENAGIGATRNRTLQMARGEYFLPMDADNIAHPNMIERFADALTRNPQLTAVSSYFLAFQDEGSLAAEKFAYSYRPTGGPHFLSAIKNVYGDGNALYRTADLRAVGGYATDRDSSWEDWEVFVRLVKAGFEVDVIPEFLFYYRHRDDGFSRETDAYRNHQRVLRRFVEMEHVPREEHFSLWNALAGFHQRLEHLENENRHLNRRLAARRYRVADWAHAWLCRVRSFLSL